MKLYNNLLLDFKTNYMLYIPLSIILQSCIGSAAVLYVLQNSTKDAFPFFQLTLCVIVTMAYNASVLAQLNYKLVFNLLLFSLLTNILLWGSNI